jgi:hypothetical protein
VSRKPPHPSTVTDGHGQTATVTQKRIGLLWIIGSTCALQLCTLNVCACSDYLFHRRTTEVSNCRAVQSTRALYLNELDFARSMFALALTRTIYTISPPSPLRCNPQWVRNDITPTTDVPQWVRHVIEMKILYASRCVRIL